MSASPSPVRKIATELRDALMRRMRQENIQDASIARVLDVSRQYVGQQLGPAGPDLLSERLQARVDRLRQLIGQGLTLRQCAREMNVSYPTACSLATEYLPEEWGAAKNLRGFRQTEALMRAAYHALGDQEFTWSNLLRYDRRLPNRSRRYMTFEEWREHLKKEA